MFDPALLEPEQSSGFDPSLLEPEEDGFDPNLLEPDTEATPDSTPAPIDFAKEAASLGRQRGRQDVNRDYLAGNAGLTESLYGDIIKAGQSAMQKTGDFTRALTSDVLDSALHGDSGETPSLEAFFKGTELPNDKTLRELSATNPNLAIAGKIGQGAVATAPLLALGVLPVWAQRLASVGFTIDMIHAGGDAAKVLGEELGKNPEDRNPDVITSAKASLLQTPAFVLMAGLHGGRDALEKTLTPKTYAARQLAEQLGTKPFDPNLQTEAQGAPLEPGAQSAIRDKAPINFDPNFSLFTPEQIAEIRERRNQRETPKEPNQSPANAPQNGNRESVVRAGSLPAGTAAASGAQGRSSAETPVAKTTEQVPLSLKAVQEANPDALVNLFETVVTPENPLHKIAVESGLTMTETDIPALEKMAKDGLSEFIASMESGDAVAQKASQFKQSFATGAIEGIRQAGPNYTEATTSFDPAKVPVREVAISEISLSEDVPNFKAGADEKTGVVSGQALSGKYERLGTAPIVLWERRNGTKEVITGRHRFDLAKRTGEKTIPAQIVREEDGFTKDMALTFDAESNIRDGQGTVEDYARYFRIRKISEEEARARGLRSRAKGDSGWHLGKNASDDLYALYRAEKVPEAKAVAIAKAAPGNAELQALGIKQSLKGKSVAEIENFIRAVSVETGGKSEQIDLFGRDDSALHKAEEMAAKASGFQKDISQQIKSAQNAVNLPEAAAKLGVNVSDPKSSFAKLSELKAELVRWQNWPLHPDLVEKVGGKIAALSETEEPFGKLPTGEAKTTLSENVAEPVSKEANAQKAASVTQLIAKGEPVPATKGYGRSKQLEDAGYRLNHETETWQPASNPAPKKNEDELFPANQRPFNLAGEKSKFIEPTKSETGYGGETLTQNDLFSIEKLTEAKDPFKSADAAEKMYGGAKEAVKIVERQLSVLDTNPDFKKQFGKEQRARLKEVINVLRERAGKSSASAIAGVVADAPKKTNSPAEQPVRLTSENEGSKSPAGTLTDDNPKASAPRDPQTGTESNLTSESKKVNEDEQARSSVKGDPFERAQKGDESAFDDLDAQFREIFPDESADFERFGHSDPNTVHTPEAFAKLFNKAFAERDFDSIHAAIKATSDVKIWKPFLREQFKNQATDPIAAKKADWMRHVFNGTRPEDALPPKPPRAAPTPKPPPRPSTGPTPGPGSTPKPPPGPPPKPPGGLPPRIEVDPIPGGGGKSPFRIIEDFSKAIGKAIRVLRMKKNGLGVYRPGSTLTAERFAGDLDTAAHELAGHWTDDKYGVGKPWVKSRTRSPYDTELAKFWVHGSVTPTSTLRYRRAEGIAEYVRAYVVNPKQAKLDAPTFSAYFEKTLPPEALKAIDDFGQDIRRWAGDEPLHRAGLNIRMEPPTTAERLWEGIRGRGFGFKVSPFDRLRLWFDDPYHYAVKAFHQATELRGLPIKPEQNFELLARLLATHDARMSDQFERGLVPLEPGQKANAKGELEVERLIDPVTKKPMTMKWLLDAFDLKDMATANQEMRDASAYMVAQRTIEKGAQLGRDYNVSGIGAGIMTDVRAAKELLAQVAKDPARKVRLDQAARRYRLWANKNIEMLVDAGRLSKEQANVIRESNQQYVDMHRLSDEFEAGFRQQHGRKIGTAKDAIKGFKGSSLELDNVYSNLLEQTDAIQKEAHRNVVMRSFTDALTQVRELHGKNLIDFDQFGRKVKAEDRNTIRVFEDGKVEHWQFDPDIYQSLKGLGELGTHPLLDLGALPIKLARYLITHGPQFMARNPIRDTVQRSVTSRNQSKPWDILQGYTQADLSRYEVFGGGQFGNYIVDRHVWNRVLKKTMRELTKDPTNIFLSPLKLKDAWEHLAESSEKLGRVAEFRRAFEHGKKELGYDDRNAALYAAGEARGLLDFAKAGTVMQVINRLIPFSNATVRGLARDAFAIKENPVRFAKSWGMFVVVPTLAVMAWNRRDKETWEEYQQQPAYIKDMFWNIKVGPYWLRIPRPHEQGVMAGGVERAIARMIGDKKAMEGYWGSVKAGAMPVSSTMDATGPLKSILEIQNNRDSFRDRDIIPIWERDLKLELRKGTVHASGAGKGIASALNATGLTVDPRQVDHVLNSYGGLGQIATTGTKSERGIADLGLKTTGYVIDPPGSSARDVQWVIDWAKENGKMSSARMKKLSGLRTAIFEAKTATERAYRSKALRSYATKERAEIEATEKH